MTSSDRSYLEIKVTFIHVFILLVAVVIIGVFLFYLGFQAGKSSYKNQVSADNLGTPQGATEEITIEDQPKREPPNPAGASAIDREMRVHDQPAKKKAAPEQKIAGKPLVKEPYYSIQVGAFAEYANAKRESDRFNAMGYETEILSIIQQNRKLFRVRVGRFTSRDAAVKEKTKLEKQLKRRFTIATSD